MATGTVLGGGTATRYSYRPTAAVPSRTSRSLDAADRRRASLRGRSHAWAPASRAGGGAHGGTAHMEGGVGADDLPALGSAPGWLEGADPVPDPLRVTGLGAAGGGTGPSGSAATMGAAGGASGAARASDVVSPAGPAGLVLGSVTREDPGSAPGGTGAERTLLVRRLVYALASRDAAGQGVWADATVPTDPDELRALLGFILTTRPPGPLPEPLAADLDTLLEAEAAERGAVDAVRLPALAMTHGVPGRLGRVAALWRGDLVRLSADAVLNAARSRMLGCFVPGHGCTDNVLHAAAGPGLREECDRYMRQAERFDPRRRAAGEPVGSAVLTQGYHLPARHVIHTVGPVIEPGTRPTAADRRALTACYTSALDVAVAAGMSSIGLCPVSTGAFGYPRDLAGLVTVEAVVSWVSRHPDAPLRIVLAARTEADALAYERALAPPP